MVTANIQSQLVVYDIMCLQIEHPYDLYSTGMGRK